MPPGRTGRLWARERLHTARRGIDVLEQKTHALVQEHRRLEVLVEQTRRAWEDATRDAQRWLRRATVIGGSQQLELARGALGSSASATVRWRSTMGVTYPSQVDVRIPETPDLGGLARSSALVEAASAHRDAVRAGLDHAAATRALALVDRELATTRRRLSALEHRWVPQLRQALDRVQLRLAEEERQDMVRTRWAARQREGDLP